MGVLLQVEAVTVRFGGLVANDAVDLRVDQGDIAALIGPNGAGKTTLFNVITGAQKPTSGRVHFAGTEITSADRAHRARLGMARTFQNLSLVGGLSALDNVGVGLGRFRRSGLPGAMLRLPRATRQDRWIRAVSAACLAFVGLEGAAQNRASDLSYGDRRRLEIARALALSPRILLLDEPSAGMDPSETTELVGVIRRSSHQLGITVLLVEHDMSFVRRLAERTTVLEFGRVLAAGPTDEVLSDPRVAAAYLGTRKEGAGAR
ncbi:MAG: ABC transporter ATP-binding protein [Acidimicrobiales bacterium]